MCRCCILYVVFTVSFFFKLFINGKFNAMCSNNLIKYLKLTYYIILLNMYLRKMLENTS